MKTLVFATNNEHKIKEVKAVLDGTFAIENLASIGCTEELPETTRTIEGNALQKARYVYDHFHVDCFSEDTGLEIFALNGAPGVDTAYYAGPQRSAADNNNLVLQQLGDRPDRDAQFRTIIALILDGKEHLFEGVVKGRIAYQAAGTRGFGYGPIFIPEGYDYTFAELPDEVKNTISHRARAVAKLTEFLAKM